MTREDAIKTLYELRRETNDTWYEEVYNMAIEALSERSIAREIATILENEQDMRVMLQNDAVHGEWKHTITWQPYCSNCEYVFGEDEEFSPFWKYCPMCGARMVKESEE